MKKQAFGLPSSPYAQALAPPTGHPAEHECDIYFHLSAHSQFQLMFVLQVIRHDH